MDDSPEVVRLELTPLPDEPPPREIARGNVIKALTELVSAIRVLELSSWRAGWDKHHEWTTTQLQKFAEQAATEASAQVRNAAHEVPTAPMTGTGTLFGDAAVRPAADVVYEYIQKYPGSTGVEIVRGLEAHGTPIHERTVRTAIFRLKQDKITAIANRWFTIEKVREMRLEGVQL
jgi:hypothetical protein